jgi:hypothetical protein
MEVSSCLHKEKWTKDKKRERNEMLLVKRKEMNYTDQLQYLDEICYLK